MESTICDYLQAFDMESIKTLVKVVQNFKSVSSKKFLKLGTLINIVDNNISYQSVGMFWKIGDYIARLQEQEKNNERAGLPDFEAIWLLILNKLVKDANSDHSELRISAIHTFTNLMVHHGNNLK